MIKALVKIHVASPDPTSSAADVFFAVKQNLVILAEFVIFIMNEILLKDPFIFDTKMQFMLDFLSPFLSFVNQLTFKFESGP